MVTFPLPWGKQRQIGSTTGVGISPDRPARQANFDTKYGARVPLFADEDHKVAQAYGVWVERSMHGRNNGDPAFGVPH
jgi:peroxiredoxin Q/BCP